MSGSAARDERLWTILNRSLPGRAVHAVADAWQRAIPSSHASARWTALTRAWTAMPPVERWRVVGIFCTVACGTHLLMAWSRGPIGLWWLIIPAIVASFGLSAMLVSWMARSSG